MTANECSPHTVRDLINTLAQCNQDAIVTIGSAPGPLGHIPETVNGYVILDCGPPLPAGFVPERGFGYRS